MVTQSAQNITLDMLLVSTSKRLLGLLAIASGLYFTGCFTRTPDVAERPRSGFLGEVLSRNLVRFGCDVDLRNSPLQKSRVAFAVEDRPTDVTLWIEGDFASDILTEFKRRFGNPAFYQFPDSNGHLSFAYGKVPAGAFVQCGVDSHAAWGLKPPMTHVVISREYETLRSK